VKGYRFYEEFDSSYKKRKRQGTGNVLALDIDPETGRPYGQAQMTWPNGCPGKPGPSVWVMECAAAVLSEPNSPIAGTMVSRDVLSKNYRRITEAQARKIHPAMFAFLDSFAEEKATQ
jgi:hypothetical protein